MIVTELSESPLLPPGYKIPTTRGGQNVRRVTTRTGVPRRFTYRESCLDGLHWQDETHPHNHVFTGTRNRVIRPGAEQYGHHEVGTEIYRSKGRHGGNGLQRR